MTGQNLARVVSTQEPYRWEDNRPAYINPNESPMDHTLWQYRGQKQSVVALDFGIKFNILRLLSEAGFEVIVVPGFTGAGTIQAMQPDGIFLSNGPGDPEPVTEAVDTIRTLLDYRPIFGICLGHQLLGLALGGGTFKLKFGHRGANQPVKNLKSGKIEVTSQNHGFAVDMETLDDKDVEITHVNLNDNTLEGFRHRKLPIFSVQYHPEASPGPHDARYLFDDFKMLMQ
jgi:carbamoyl-phosphate synthase small subunit